MLTHAPLTAPLQCTSQAANTGCLQCDATGARCIQCNDGYALVKGQCTKCNGGDQCKTCGPDLVCTQCKAQLYPPAYGLNEAKQCVPVRNAGGKGSGVVVT